MARWLDDSRGSRVCPRPSPTAPRKPCRQSPRRLQLSSMPLQLLPTTSEPYTTLINLLSASPLQVLELDILPSSHAPIIHSAPQSVALPKSLLASLFLTARAVFFSYIASQKGNSQENDKLQSQSSNEIPSSYTAAFDATLILLLWDPNHLTAANFRKRHLLSLRAAPRPTSFNLHLPNDHLLNALDTELTFLSSLFTSPLTKATKSPTLWAQRQWLLQTFEPEIATLGSLRERIPHSSSDQLSDNVNDNIKHSAQQQNSRSTQEALLESEMQIVMRAGERHPRNYYAWGYARNLITSTSTSTSTSTYPPALSNLNQTHKWCLLHPRDISAWSFLTFLFHHLHFPFPSPSPSSPIQPVHPKEIIPDEDEQQRAVAAMEQVIQTTREFVRKYEWRGESVEWFLRMVGEERGYG